MSEHMTEEEQIESIKRWWAESGQQVIITLVLIFGGYFGFEAWQDHNQQQAQQASLQYNEMLALVSGLQPGELIAADDAEQIDQLADALKAEHGDSQYARYGALLKSRVAVEAERLDDAVSELQWVLDSDADASLAAIVTLRLARVEAARGNVDTALQMVQGVDAGELKSAYAEAQGDFYVQQGKQAAARTAYQSAMDSLVADNGSSAGLLGLKLSALPPAAQSIDESAVEPSTEQSNQESDES